MNTVTVETVNLTRRYGKFMSVNNVNLKVPQGEIYGFLGPNGAGKTTTIRMLLGLIKPTRGEIAIFGKELSKNRIPILKRVGSLVESPSYYGHLSGRQNLKVLARLLQLPDKRIDEVLDLVRLTKNAQRPVNGYSLGMKQRLGIAAALISRPELLILDEPTNGLDPAGIQEIRELIIQMPKEYGITVLISSHLLSEIEQVATYVGIIDQGKLVFQNSMNELRKLSQRNIHVEVNQPIEASLLLQKQGWKVSIEDNILSFPSITHEQTASIVKELVLHRFSVYRVVEHKMSLEDTFLELTGTRQSL
ncbi:ABC transporter ATP-binding protein [Aneurinibacillus migulanus]|uniref:ABC-2 type transport system ATP-binding protein n=1 Tax=Aneurinibacillus migulanus TaxID=47500 RepID=A0A0D1XM45_ANEMI|nr:ABC transporter ATP-binding protein [Aneurinibacillus migulanus]KIV55346.1 bacitracin ABC transporter ATP-binding protein [Aneurinibacillus migulanus]KON96662.1 bacitracin ABC transporter ATP-binding protein [Aneurinibacillus migulanus]MED0896459.1 ABC transporter ATP-binding protein [Aneurinibacillus migulanus]MED1618211.1 ABC transporter ATP-binding protein [Aneurinibacillus migulanus]SDJ84913.1 ABC-2 type transport system ATP-binding protein [Aneurinibacillus migulanus]